jgi:7,8-dihydropterin-6-yl-methyl-4-(beta-D-ribofuranosyl)aminobenzene 5'-phosphate synthase
MRFLAVMLVCLCAARAETAPLSSARVVVLSTMLADKGVGEWGFAALVEADGQQVLFDTGARPQTVLENAKELGVDLSKVTHVVLSHWHGDHTGGLLVLRQEMMKKNPAALSQVHVGRGFFWPRRREGKAVTSAVDLRKAYEATGGRIIEHAEATQLLPGFWLTGTVPRQTAEKNYPPGFEVQRPDGKWSADDVPDDHSLILDTKDGLVAVIGCGHAGVVNTLYAAQARVRKAPVVAVLGGLHVFGADDAALDWTAGELKKLGVANLMGAHCTGIEATMRLRQGAGLSRKTAVVGAVGASYTLGKGIDPGTIAR